VSEQLNESVAARLEALLARVEGVKLASDIGRPVKFDRAGELHARRIAQTDQTRGQ